MGKRKSSKPEPSRKKVCLPNEFDCPSCNFSNCVEVKLYKKKKEGEIYCRICKVDFRTQINPVMEAADVYCLWMDECERVNDEKLAQNRTKTQTNANYNQSQEDEDDSLISESDDMEVGSNLKKRGNFDISRDENIVNGQAKVSIKRVKGGGLTVRKVEYKNDTEIDSDMEIKQPVKNIAKVMNSNDSVESIKRKQTNTDSESSPSQRVTRRKKKILSDSESDVEGGADLEKELMD